MRVTPIDCPTAAALRFAPVNLYFRGEMRGRLKADTHASYAAFLAIFDHEIRQEREHRWANRWPRAVSRWDKLVHGFERRGCVVEFSAERKKIFVGVGYRACQ